MPAAKIRVDQQLRNHAERRLPRARRQIRASWCNGFRRSDVYFDGVDGVDGGEAVCASGGGLAAGRDLGGGMWPERVASAGVALAR
jgi:hypothetical protein